MEQVILRRELAKLAQEQGILDQEEINQFVKIELELADKREHDKMEDKREQDKRTYELELERGKNEAVRNSI